MIECPHCKGKKTIGWRLIEIVAGESKGPYFIASGARCEFVPIECPVCSSRVLECAPEHEIIIPAMRPGESITIEPKGCGQ